jgi:hypothetical protein
MMTPRMPTLTTKNARLASQRSGAKRERPLNSVMKACCSQYAYERLAVDRLKDENMGLTWVTSQRAKAVMPTRLERRRVELGR